MRQSLAAALTARLRTGYRAMEKCNCEESQDGHAPSEHVNSALAALYEVAKTEDTVEAVLGIYEHPCDILSFEDESVCYVPKNGYGSDGMAYTIRSRHSLVHRLASLAPMVPSPELHGDTMLTEEETARILQALQNRFADNTKRSYLSQWQQWMSWARQRGIDVLPADPLQICAWITFRAEEFGHKPPTLRLALAALRAVHRSLRVDGTNPEGTNPCEVEIVTETMSGLSRMHGLAQSQATGFTDAHLAAVEATALIPRRGRGGRLESPEIARHRGLVDIALLYTMRDGLLRRSEASDLRWEDVAQWEDGTGRITVVKSKTDQHAKGVVLFISQKTMETLGRIRADATPHDRVFGLSPVQIGRRIKAATRAAMLDGNFSGHSPRVGMSQDLARVGFDLPALMTAGRWKSPTMPALYTRAQRLDDGAVAQYYRFAD